MHTATELSSRALFYCLLARVYIYTYFFRVLPCTLLMSPALPMEPTLATVGRRCC